IPRLASLVPEVDGELDELVARAVAADPTARYQTANELRQAIERYLRKAGQVVRELEVGEAMTGAFGADRAALQAQIREAMRGIDGDSGPGEVVPPSARAMPARVGRGRRVLIGAGALGVLGALAWAGVIIARPGAGVPAVSPVASLCPTPIRVRVLYDMTGSTREVGTAAGKGESDYLRAINAAGGIRGCKLEIDLQDTQYDKSASLEVYRRWKARADWPEVSTVFLQGTPITQAVAPLASEEHKVVMSSAFAGEFAAPAPTSVDVSVPSLSGAFSEASVMVHKQSPGYPWVFFQGIDYSTAARVAANFAWHQGARRMAFFYCSTSSYCTDPVDGVKTFLHQLGGTRIGRDLAIELDDDVATVEHKVLAFFQQERAYKTAHPDYEVTDWVWFGNTSGNTPALAKALKKARELYHVDLNVIGNNWSVDESLYAACGEPCVGFHVVQPFGLFGDRTASGTATLLADHATYRKLDGDPPDAYQTVQYVYGRVAVATWKLAVERLLDAGRPVTGPNLRAMLESFRRVDVDGFATVSYSATDHRPSSSARLAKLGPHGHLDPVGQPMSLSLQPSWLGW
ncbi:MAG TPA: ABC transporter substrate-binding protein, partial [Kofleriaceae bacterium]